VADGLRANSFLFGSFSFRKEKKHISLLSFCVETYRDVYVAVGAGKKQRKTDWRKLSLEGSFTFGEHQVDTKRV